MTGNTAERRKQMETGCPGSKGGVRNVKGARGGEKVKNIKGNKGTEEVKIKKKRELTALGC